MRILKRTTGKDTDFQALIKFLDNDLNNSEYTDQSTRNTFNLVSHIETVIVCYENESAIGCGCFKKFDEKAVEIKRMFVKPESRGKGIAGEVLKNLENWAKELGFEKAILETGNKQFEAIGLYTKMGYESIPRFGVYENMEDSVCFARGL